MEVDDIISYHDVVTAERAALQKGMNYGVGKNYSVFLMSLRENAPYADALDPFTGMLTYEGHDEPQRRGGSKSERSWSALNDSERIVDGERKVLSLGDGFQKLSPARERILGE
jgi:hypothetical protein